MIPGDDGVDPERLLRGVMGLATSQIAQRRFAELGHIALNCAEAGVSFCYTSQFADKEKPESKARAIAFIMCGEIPDDLLQMIEDYARGAAQDFTAGNKNLKLLYKRDDRKPE